MSAATCHKIYIETVNHIDRHMARVKEGRDVDGAKLFANWLFWSGIPTLLKENSEPAPLKCDGAFLSWKLNELIEACNEFYRTNKPVGLNGNDIQSIHERLDKLTGNLDTVAGGLSRLIGSSSQPSTPPAPVCEAGGEQGAGGAQRLPFPALPLPCQGVTTRMEVENERIANEVEQAAPRWVCP